MPPSTPTRRGVLAASGVALTAGCSSLLGDGQSRKLPVLRVLELQNRTPESREFRLRVRHASDLDADPSVEFEASGTISGYDDERRFSEEFEGRWPERPGRFAVDVALGADEFATEDITERLVQEREERICYHHLVAITDGGLDSYVNVDPSCPDGLE